MTSGLKRIPTFAELQGRMNSSLTFTLVITVLACALVSACGDNDSGNRAPAMPAGTGNSAAGGSSPTANSPPQISGGSPPEATAGTFWAWQPSLYDPDGDTRTVSASNLPGWLTLNENSGRLSGTPEDGDIRTWSGIALTVSDGSASDTLPVFAITVVDENAAGGSVTLSWVRPTLQVDGSPIDELSGYRLLYGQASRTYTETVVIDNPGITTYMVEGLASGDWYFAIQTVDGDGLISQPSAEARARI